MKFSKPLQRFSTSDVVFKKLDFRFLKTGRLIFRDLHANSPLHVAARVSLVFKKWDTYVMGAIGLRNDALQRLQHSAAHQDGKTLGGWIEDHSVCA